MKKLFFPFVLLLAASVVFTGCHSDDDSPTPDLEYIVVADEETLEQEVYADETEGESGVRFTTLAPWTSSVTEDWVSIDPTSGGTGTYNIVISLAPNFTGEPRSAVITITSSGTTIEIHITQQGETEEGYVPVNPEDHSIIRAENIVGDDFSEVDTVRVAGWRWCFDEEEEKEWTFATAPFVNNGFTLHLPETVSDNYLMPMRRSFENFTMSDENTQWALIFDGSINAHDKNGRKIGWFEFSDRTNYTGTGDDINAIATWIYVDRDVTIQGTYRSECCCGIWEESIDLDLSRGWNMTYEYYRAGILIFTTKKPSDIDFRWHFIGDDDWFPRSATTRARENKRSVFRR